MDLSPDEENFPGRLLHQAALWDNVELLRELLAAGTPPDAADPLGRRALHAAALAEGSQCLRALLAAGAAVDAACHEAAHGQTPLHVAAARGHADNVARLLAGGACAARPDAAGATPLQLAERGGHGRAARLLREARDAQERARLTQHAQLRDAVLRGDSAELRGRLAALGDDAGLLVNWAPGGANTLLYIASEAGSLPSVSTLLEFGADGRAHPTTQYSPLYAACRGGHAAVGRLLLETFPDAAKQESVEKWLPLHAACLGGHAACVRLLLEHPYPETTLAEYTAHAGAATLRYRFAFDVNARDAAARSALHCACAAGHAAAARALLAAAPRPLQEDDETPASPHRAGISLGIHAIVSRLTRQSSKTSPPPRPPCVVELSTARDGCLAAAARGGHLAAVELLLDAGADPDGPAAPLKPAEPAREGRRRSRSAAPHPAAQRDSRDLDSRPWTPLALAAAGGHGAVLCALLQRGAADRAGRALALCRGKLAPLLPPLLATRAYPDTEYKLNKPYLTEAVFSGADTSLTYTARCPTTPVAVDWRELRCDLAAISMQCLTAACLRVNPALSGAGAPLAALTRLDAGGNDLRAVPAELFALCSLRYLNLAQNKIERLPTLSDLEEEGKSKRGKKKTPATLYSAPVLQDLYLQDNRLTSLPPELFALPSLQTLDASNNKLGAAPARLWLAPRLQDLNLSLNLLPALPALPEGMFSEAGPGGPLVASHTSGSLASNNSSKSCSRSPSIEHGVCDAAEDEDGVPLFPHRAPHAASLPVRHAHSFPVTPETAPPDASGLLAPLASLNLAHNRFSTVPPPLACLAPRLQRLNMAYNSLRTMSYVTSYPASLRQLDLSHNEITCWPSLPPLDPQPGAEDPLACHCPRREPARPRGRPVSRRAALLARACPARAHLQMPQLRTLILANNLLTRIQLTTDDDGSDDVLSQPEDDDDDDEEPRASPPASRLLTPALCMLDVSCNMLRSVPRGVRALTHLAALNLHGNREITDLPPQLGLLTRLWSLNTAGCSLTEPLLTMTTSPKYRSMDVVGYLRSVLQEARPNRGMKLMFVGLQGIGKTSLLECLRNESNILHRKKPTEHWSARMGTGKSRGKLSTVGVDIGAWVYEKPRSTRGPVTFRTWDFAGQHEYYATHQYFLSKRALYICVWDVTRGRRGLAGAVEWLRSIQARAPGAPVIMVATHYDMVAQSGLPEGESPEALQRLIRTSIAGAPDADKLGLPRVVDTVEVSCTTRHNIRLLADIIYSVAFNVKPPGCKEPLLEQRVPATYLALEEAVTHLAAALPEPVLRHDEYKRMVTQYIQQKGLRMFRDSAELQQATMYLHDNGVLLHYDDAALKELYFVRPQWLCDVLASVVAVREVNPFAGNGVMRVESLPLVLRRASPALSLALLHKFELALSWDRRRVLLPALLPRSEPEHPQLTLRSKSRSVTSQSEAVPGARGGCESPSLVEEPPPLLLEARASARPLRRLLLLSHTPPGFWARLCVRLLGAPGLLDAAAAAYQPPKELRLDEAWSRRLQPAWAWRLWRRGARLAAGPLRLLGVRALPAAYDELLGGSPRADDGPEEEHPYAGLKLRVEQDGGGCELDPRTAACIEVLLPAQVCVARRADGGLLGGCQSISMEPQPEALARVLALVCDHIDTLLEDWYPSLGTRFVHTSDGRCLITRLVPCPECLRDPQPPDCQLDQALSKLDLEESRRQRHSQESRASDGADSGVGAESNASSVAGFDRPDPDDCPRVTAFTIEQCILAACTGAALRCPHHPECTLAELAPDTLFLDVEESRRCRWESLTVGEVVGRGGSGVVRAGVWRGRRVAIKTAQPPPMERDKAALARWRRDPATVAARAYSALRQELRAMAALRHPHVPPPPAVCCAPLALLLPLAPLGSLDAVLRQYRAAGADVPRRVAVAAASQVARALEYLHQVPLVYRDLKSENVLVWQMPAPGAAAAAERSADPVDVHVKLGDYGISRPALVAGTKGFGGTEGFMAPEIMKYNGEEEYNEKVDCFSFGMLLYEILALQPPFAGLDAVKDAVLDGARPAYTARTVRYGVSLLCVLRACWARAAAARPSAAALVSLLAAPDCRALLRAAAAAAAGPAAVADVGTLAYEVWCCGEPGRLDTLVTNNAEFTQQYSVPLPPADGAAVAATALCAVGGRMWVGDSSGRVVVYSISTCAVEWSVRAQDSVGGHPSAVVAMVELLNLERVALALECGRLFLATSARPEAEGGWVLTELGAASALRCLAAVATPAGVDVWAGGDGLSVYAVSAGGVSDATELGVPGVPGGAGGAGARVALAAAAADVGCVYTYVQPGCVVYQWHARTRAAGARLDCRKLLPSSESLQSIAVDDLTEDNCQVTALATLDAALYVGTRWGCVVVADARALRPIAVFRPYEGPVTAILPLPAKSPEQDPCVCTVGRGYRPLLPRYLTSQSTNAAISPTASYCLLWYARRWLPD